MTSRHVIQSGDDEGRNCKPVLEPNLKEFPLIWSLRDIDCRRQQFLYYDGFWLAYRFSADRHIGPDVLQAKRLPINRLELANDWKPFHCVHPAIRNGPAPY